MWIRRNENKQDGWIEMIKNGCVCPIDYEFEGVQVYDICDQITSVCTAVKCGECGFTIRRGEKHLLTTAKVCGSEGEDIFEFRTCLLCKKIYDDFFDDDCRKIFGQLWDYMGEYHGIYSPTHIPN